MIIQQKPSFCKEGLTMEDSTSVHLDLQKRAKNRNASSKLELSPNNINYQSRLVQFPQLQPFAACCAVIWLCSNSSQGLYWLWWNVPNTLAPVLFHTLFQTIFRMLFCPLVVLIFCCVFTVLMILQDSGLRIGWKHWEALASCWHGGGGHTF